MNSLCFPFLFFPWVINRTEYNYPVNVISWRDASFTHNNMCTKTHWRPTDLCVCVCVVMHAGLCVFVCVYVHACVFCMHVCVCVWLCVWVRVCKSVCMCTCTHIHTCFSLLHHLIFPPWFFFARKRKRLDWKSANQISV